MVEKEERTDLAEKNLIWISELSKKDIPIAGGKGANLAEMFNLGMPVPNAFVITAHAFLKFVTESKLHKHMFILMKQTIMELLIIIMLLFVQVQQQKIWQQQVLQVNKKLF